MKHFRYVALLLVALVGCTSPLPSGGQCAFNADCSSGLICAGNFCRTPCGPGGRCPSGMRCEPVVGTALTVCAVTTEEPRCVYASDCPAPLVCNRDGRCRPECREDYDCHVINPFTTCVEGACALRCTAGTADCDGLVRNGCEVDTQRDLANCGACGTVCRAGANQSVRCAQGGCAASCNAGFADCDGDAANGCEADLSAPATCGACGARCVAPRSLCQADNTGARACVSSCGGATPMECGGSCVNLQSDLANCGACGTACAAGANATAACTAGRCVSSCAQGFGDCDGDAANGCETNLQTSLMNCGACGRACSLAGASTSCSAGMCALAECNAGFADCDENAMNGCETNLSSLMSCGACGRVCGAANNTPRCTVEGCALACNQGFGDCDGSSANGCETGLNTVANCGACGRVCGAANNTPSCTVEGCVLRCNQGFADCDGDAANGCETNLTNSDAHCGACRNACATRTTQTGAAHVCTSGACLPRNDTCANAQVINLGAGTPITVRASTRFARREFTAPCTEGSAPEVWFQFTLTQREIVYADTLGSDWDTVLYFTSSCSPGTIIRGGSAEVRCNDDLSSRCKTSGLASQVYAVFEPGTHYLVLAGSGNAVGDLTLNLQHLPVGNGSVGEYPVGFFEGLNFLFGNLGTTSGTQGTCGGVGPESSFWFVTCPGESGGGLVANTCSSVNQGYNTVLYLRHGNGAPEVCNNDAPTVCPNNPQGSAIDTTITGAPGVHVLTLDSFDTSGTTGSFELRSAYPIFN